MACVAPFRRGGGGGGNPSAAYRCRSLLLSLPADVRSSGDVIAFAGFFSNHTKQVRL